VLAAAGALVLTSWGELPRATTVGGVEVGGLSRDDARALLRRTIRERLATPIQLVSDAGRETVTGAELGARPRLAVALEEADRVGFLGRLARRIGFGATREVPLSYDLSPAGVRTIVDTLNIVVGVPPLDASVEAGKETIRATSSENGTAVDRRALVQSLQSLPARVEVRLRVARPAITTKEAEAAVTAAEELVADRRFVGMGATVVRLDPAALRRMLIFEPRGSRLVLDLDRDLLAIRLRKLATLEQRPRNARWVTRGRRAYVVPARPGRELDVDRIAASLLSNRDAVTQRARFTPVTPAFTTADAEKLRITELVSEFTTQHSCCAPRVTNIHRAAELLDGTVLLPGQKFSLNKALGKRTRERGFVEAPQIFAGRLQDAVGGGVSQVATTLYNAAFFAGLRLDAHQPHQFYISRYPMGREATVSWGGPELIFTNNWPAAVLMRFLVTDTSITIRFFSSKLGRRVITKTGEPCCYVAPRTYVSVDRRLPPGARKVQQSAGPSGFTVEYTRRVFRGDKLLRNERYRVRYDAEHAFVVQGPAKKPQKKPGKGATGPPAAGATPASPGQPDARGTGTERAAATTTSLAGS
jgi:vancomycin resistance protein YoaR